MKYSRNVTFGVTRLLGVLIAAGFLAGCSSMFPVQSYSIQSAQADPALAGTGKLSLLDYGQAVHKPYRVLGKVMAFKRGGLGAVRELDDVSPPSPEMLVGLKQQAVALGADAIIGVYHGEYRGVNVAADYASGLAVQFVPDTRAPVTAQTGFRVGILPVQVGKIKLEPKEYAVLDRDFRAGARWFLEDKGYYAPVDPAVHFHGGLADLRKMPASALQRLYGDDTDLLLLVEVIDEQAVTPLLVEYRKVVLKASLYSKSLHKVLWDNKVQNERVTGVFWTWMTKPVTRAATIEAVLKPLPFYTRIGNASEYSSFAPASVKKHR